MRSIGSRRRQRIDELERVLRAVGPQNVLRRGYSYTTDGHGRLVQSSHQGTAGDRIVTHLVDGRVESQVVGEQQPPATRPAAEKRLAAGPASRRSPSRRRTAPQAGGLFEQDNDAGRT